jgi:hypothetical protein
MTQMDPKNLIYVEVGVVYVLSSNDVDLICSLLQPVGVELFELLESRKVEFPNPYFVKKVASQMAPF